MKKDDTVRIINLGSWTGFKGLKQGDTGTVQKVHKNGKVMVAVHSLRQVRDGGDGLRSLRFEASQLELI